MKFYQSHKIVKAVKCDKIYITGRDDGMMRLLANDQKTYEVKDNFFARGNPEGAFYIVEYADGYRSWSPADAFEDGYVGLKEGTDEESYLLDFGMAVSVAQDGKKIARDGWNGKGMFVFYVPANKYHASGNKKGTLLGMFPDDMVPYREYLAMKTADDQVVPWVASQSDILAKDWRIVE